MKNGIRTCELDDISAEFAAKLVNEYPQYEILAARIAISNLHKETTKQFSGKWLFQNHFKMSHLRDDIGFFILLSIKTVLKVFFKSFIYKIKPIHRYNNY